MNIVLKISYMRNQKTKGNMISFLSSGTKDVISFQSYVNLRLSNHKTVSNRRILKLSKASKNVFLML